MSKFSTFSCRGRCLIYTTTLKRCLMHFGSTNGFKLASCTVSRWDYACGFGTTFWQMAPNSSSKSHLPSSNSLNRSYSSLTSARLTNISNRSMMRTLIINCCQTTRRSLKRQKNSVLPTNKLRTSAAHSPSLRSPFRVRLAFVMKPDRSRSLSPLSLRSGFYLTIKWPSRECRQMTRFSRMLASGSFKTKLKIRLYKQWLEVVTGRM